jgi:hypothetical protein
VVKAGKAARVVPAASAAEAHKAAAEEMAKTVGVVRAARATVDEQARVVEAARAARVEWGESVVTGAGAIILPFTTQPILKG